MIDPQRWGVEPGYEDHARRWIEVPKTSIDALLEAMGASPSEEEPPTPGAWVALQGDELPLPPGRWELREESGAVSEHTRMLPRDLGLGYHRLRGRDTELTLIVSPGRCYLPERMRTWGWASQLYATRSTNSWGIGDLADLRALNKWAADAGAGLTLLNPLHASLPGVPQEPSPYSPSSRCWRNPLYLSIEDVPGAAAADGFGVARVAGRALNDSRRIDRDEVWRLKLGVLEEVWRGFRADDRFLRYLEEGGPTLYGYATFCALSEVHGRRWHSWPAGLRAPGSGDVSRFAAEHRRRILFHAWLQWLVDEQLRAASTRLGVMQDLAVGVHPDGADAWLWQDCFAASVRVGAPPDEFNTQGQDWGLPPFDPWRLRAMAYEPFIRTVRQGLRHAAGLRVDHAMGLFRLFWVPVGGDGPAAGGYVRYPSQDLLRILALESVRAGAYIVGEDLGLVTDEARRALTDAGVLSYRLLWFEPDPPSAFPKQALAAVTTHDLPTVSGLLSGDDLKRQDELDMEPNVESTNEIARRVRGWARITDDDTPAEAVVKVHEVLAEAPSAIVTATLDDAVLEPLRPNYPGTVNDDNWSTALAKPLEEIVTDGVANRIAASLARGRPGGGGGGRP